MPPNRVARARAPTTDENDENVGTTRLTRAKAAALEKDDPGAGVKKPLQTKTAATNTLKAGAAPVQRKRAALGDVSNVTKGDAADGKEGKEGKKATTTTTVKGGLVSKASLNSGIQKASSRPQASRPALGSKDGNKKAAVASELKRPASGSGVMGGTQKKRQTTSNSSQKTIHEEVAVVEETTVDPAKKEFVVEIEQSATTETEDEAQLEGEIDPKIYEDLDAQDLGDPLMVAEYVHEIFEHLKVLEVATLPNANYMDHQEDLEWKMRGILVDWLIEVHTRFHLLPETLFLAVNIIDRFLSNKVVQLDRLQLVGVTAMFIASKYEEVLSPHVGNFRHVADDGFTEQEILSAERYVLSALNYDLSYPNPMNFLRRISKADNYDIQTRTLGKYLMEISLLDHQFMQHRPSLVAASSMYLARLILERGEWDATLAHYAGYNEQEIEPVFKLMVDYLAKPVAHEAFFKKYASKKFLKASILTRQWAKKYAAVYGIDVAQTGPTVA